MSLATGHGAPGFALPSKPGDELDVGALIGSDGRIANAWVTENADEEPDCEAVKAAARAA